MKEKRSKMKVGFTGSRHGMTGHQRMVLARFVEDHSFLTFQEKYIQEFHHGDCIGADEQAHSAVRQYHSTCKIVVHPPSIITVQAYCVGDESREPKPYLERNRNIVDETDMLIATPNTDYERQRSGTWSTVRYARSQGKQVTIIYPDGNIEKQSSVPKRRQGSLAIETT